MKLTVPVQKAVRDRLQVHQVGEEFKQNSYVKNIVFYDYTQDLRNSEVAGFIFLKKIC
jgi:hypothetical protein